MPPPASTFKRMLTDLQFEELRTWCHPRNLLDHSKDLICTPGMDATAYQMAERRKSAEDVHRLLCLHVVKLQGGHGMDPHLQA